MQPEDLRDYIIKFREWIKLHAEGAVGAERNTVVAAWHKELEVAERLLEIKPELPIAFLGPSQQGKSSLINALLGEPILAVGGAIGACTCVITSVHHRAGDNYRAEIDFISIEDWKSELLTIQQTMAIEPSAEETDLDRKEREAAHKNALEKYNAVYRDESLAGLPKVLDDVFLGLPYDIVTLMSDAQPLVVEEDKARSLRNKIRRYLVGRDQQPDAQFWPLISRVRIYGNFDVLANGAVLVDLPGLNDPNPAREQVTKRYLEEARHIWLVCNSQSGIDRVFTQILRDEGFLLTLFLEGRLEAFSVIATRIDDINVQAVLEQMGVDPDEFDGNYSAVMDFRCKEIASYIKQHLSVIAGDIAAGAADGRQRDAFLGHIEKIPVLSISTSAYLHAQGQMPLYQGMKLSAAESRVPDLISHLHSITLEQSYKAQVEASFQRLHMLHEQARRFFLDRIHKIEVDTDDARKEWETLTRVITDAVQLGHQSFKRIHIRSEESLRQRCEVFELQIADLEGRAAKALLAVFASWQGINWRSLQAAMHRRGKWFSASLQREFDFSRDVARAYIDLLPFIWEEFFGDHLLSLIEETANSAQAVLHNTVERVMGAMDMLRHQPQGLREVIEGSLSASNQSFQIQAGQVRAALVAEIQRTRQSLSSGMIETASGFMQPTYDQASKVPGGHGIKQRMLDVIILHAKKEAPSLFINMQKELAEGVDVLQGSMKPQLGKIIRYGTIILQQFEQNVTSYSIVTPEQRKDCELAMDYLPEIASAIAVANYGHAEAVV